MLIFGLEMFSHIVTKERPGEHLGALLGLPGTLGLELGLGLQHELELELELEVELELLLGQGAFSDKGVFR